MRVFSGGGGAAQGNSYVDRGDVAAPDFAVGDLTTDGAYHDMDLSSIVPAGAVAVHIRVDCTDDSVASTFNLRENGNSNSINVFQVICRIANVTVSQDGIVTCDSSRVIEYFATNTVWTSLNVTVKGWWV